MVPHLTHQLLKVAVDAFGTAENGVQFLADDVLVAVVSHLEHTAPQGDEGRWYLEVGFGPCATAEAARPVFDTLDAAQAWVMKRTLR